jgi:hypothetical protein
MDATMTKDPLLARRRPNYATTEREFNRQIILNEVALLGYHRKSAYPHTAPPADPSPRHAILFRNFL